MDKKDCILIDGYKSSRYTPPSTAEPLPTAQLESVSLLSLSLSSDSPSPAVSQGDIQPMKVERPCIYCFFIGRPTFNGVSVLGDALDTSVISSRHGRTFPNINKTLPNITASQGDIQLMKVERPCIYCFFFGRPTFNGVSVLGDALDTSVISSRHGRTFPNITKHYHVAG